MSDLSIRGKSLLMWIALCLQGVASGEEAVGVTKPLILDMVHHNPGETLYETSYEDPVVLKQMGFNGKVYYLFDSPTLAITWESIDPDILPKGSKEREWVDEKAARIRAQHKACKAKGVSIYAMADLILFPRRLIEKYELQRTFGDPRHPQTQKFLKAQLNEIFAQFPDLDGLVVRIGETYLHDAPFHRGRIKNKHKAEETIIPLAQLLREEVCVKLKKELIFRTWLSFDRDTTSYQKVSNAVEPHSRFTFSIKHCEGDFHRANAFSRIIGMGRHRQMIEVQCAREYEGKGAYPNYICHGVIEGFEEHARMRPEAINSIREFVNKKPELFGGIWTWTRGGGWGGPYIKDELWCDVNAWVMAQWALDTKQSEEAVFNRYAKDRLGLNGDDRKAFRKLCLLSANAVVRGRNSTHGDMDPWWTRDEGIGWPHYTEGADLKRNLRQKDESVRMWKEIVRLAGSITWPDEKARSHAVGSARYGLHLYEIYRCLVYLDDAERREDKAAMRKWLEGYDDAWDVYNKLPQQYPQLATLYKKEYTRHIRRHAETRVKKLQQELAAAPPVSQAPIYARIKDGESIAFLGDSITAGGEQHGGYCRLVMHGLRTKGVHVKGIFAGIPGNKSSDMLLRLDSILRRKPDHLFLSVGVNDVWHTDPTARIGVFKPSPGMGVELEHYKVYVPEILDRCKAAGVKVILSTFTPIMEDPEFRLNKKAIGYLDFLRSLARDRKLPIALLNEAFHARIKAMKAAKQKEDEKAADKAPRRKKTLFLTGDGVHPGTKGNHVMALGILKAMGFSDGELENLEKRWEQSPRVRIVGGRQVRSGVTRFHGWATMLMTMMNQGPAMYTYAPILGKKNTMTQDLVNRFLKSSQHARNTHFLFVPPMGDVLKKTPQKDFKALLEKMVLEAKRRKLKTILTTYPVVSPEPEGEGLFREYNNTIRNIARAHQLGMADIAQTMKAHMRKHPQARFNFDEDERLNYQGSLLMVECLGEAFELETRSLQRLKEIWAEANCYVFRYTDHTNLRLKHSDACRRIQKEVAARFHQKGSALDYGIHLLLFGKPEANQRRRKASDTWASQSDDEKLSALRLYPKSLAQKRLYEAYVKKHNIDLPTFYERAFEVGLYALRYEDPLARGTF